MFGFNGKAPLNHLSIVPFQMTCFVYTAILSTTREGVVGVLLERLQIRTCGFTHYNFARTVGREHGILYTKYSVRILLNVLIPTQFNTVALMSCQ